MTAQLAVSQVHHPGEKYPHPPPRQHKRLITINFLTLAREPAKI